MKKKELFCIAFALFLAICPIAGAQIQKEGMKNVRPEEQNYVEVRIKKFPIAIQCWTFRKLSFLETLDKIKELGVKYVQPYPGQTFSQDHPEVKFDHHLGESLVNHVKHKLNETGLSLVSYGVVNFDNNEQSMREVFDFAKKFNINTIVTEPLFDDYSLLEKMVQEYNINAAIHNHPEPSKYALPDTVRNHVQGLDARIGACADTGHWMRTGVVPVDALRKLEGRILDVHLKDLSELSSKDAFDVPFGQGKANIHGILAELTLQNYKGFLTVEHENKEDIDNPSAPIRKGIEFLKSITYFEGYEEILAQRNGRYSKHGWNHYGPGYFELDENTGILKAQGGMGLFWYSAKKFKDFTLELDYKCSEIDTNSGVFIRVPKVPVNDDYIYHSFEIQIYDSGEGTHKTGAVYDAEGPRENAFKKTGEWNHYKITFRGDHIRVELNGTLVIDWVAAPRGKIKDFAQEGYIGLQNHDSRSPVYFRNIYVKELH